MDAPSSILGLPAYKQASFINLQYAFNHADVPHRILVR